MIWINIFLIIFYLIQESDGLKHCSGANFSSLTVCKNVNDYHPGAVPEPKPLKVKIQVRILNIVDMTSLKRRWNGNFCLLSGKLKNQITKLF